MEKLKPAAKEIENLGSEAGEALGEPLGELLMAVSNISRLCKLPQEQILADKIDDLIEKYE